ncbi:MAG TPA: hypothetical protein VK880_12105, partial [Anaerolineales bacterium]|nr:hypothetical protein [Anaerolineales bacterium]
FFVAIFRPLHEQLNLFFDVHLNLLSGAGHPASAMCHPALRADKQKRARDGGRVWYTPPQVYVWM